MAFRVLCDWCGFRTLLRISRNHSFHHAPGASADSFFLVLLDIGRKPCSALLSRFKTNFGRSLV